MTMHFKETTALEKIHPIVYQIFQIRARKTAPRGGFSERGERAYSAGMSTELGRSVSTRFPWLS